jgi:2',3'-cyclic-nucleotide 2'-phosphodiesterase (5'-nucleotidase family)/DNA-binding beta-propeller fold protein YncE
MATPISITPSGALDISVKGSLALAGAEISAFDAASDRLFTTSSSGLQVVDLSNPASPSLIATVDFTALGFATTDITSVAAKNGIVAVALPAADKALPGKVVFLNAADHALLGSVDVGALPDMLTFTADGSKVLVANEGEINDTGTDGAGSVSIIDISGGIGTATVQTAGFTAFDGQEDALRAEGVRIFEGRSVSQDVEPEYISLSPDGTKALVTLQEANAIGILDIATATFTDIVPLGLKDWTGLQIDVSDRDGPGGAAAINLVNDAPVLGMYMPDGIASYRTNGQTYYIIANEGDDRDDFIDPNETIRVGSDDYDLDDGVFPNEDALKDDASLGRLTVSNAPGLRGDTDGDGDIDQILTYGGRSFSILDAQGHQVFDSGDAIERIVAQQFPALFDDTRSDNKGPEPESVAIASVGGRTFAFIGLERSNLTLAFDVTDPANVIYAGAAQNAGDIAPEGLLLIPAADSPSGKELLVTSNEASNNITVFEVQPTTFTLQLLHFSDGEAGLLAGDTAPDFAALVDAFDDDFANTLILAGGDDFLPGPFLNAGTDPSLSAVPGIGATAAGRPDIAMLNAIGVEASTIGNHEFDLGSTIFRDAFTPSGAWVGALFPYLSSNLDFSGDSALNPRFTDTLDGGTGTLIPEADTLDGRIAPSAVITKGGEKIGLVGVTTQVLEAISSPSGTEVEGFPTGPGANGEVDDMDLLAAQLQPIIDELIAEGVNKIILMSHLQQIANEQLLATKLKGVDIIMSAGSNTRLGDADDEAVAFPGHDASFDGTYPIVTHGTDGKTTLIVNTDGEYTYLGRLAVDFDANGEIILDSLTDRQSINGAYASTDENVAKAWGVDVADLDTTAFADGTKGDQVRDITTAVDAVIGAKDGNVFGFTDVYLEGERSIIRSQETNLGDLAADTGIHALKEILGAAADDQFIVGLRNGGGIRAQIGSVDIDGNKIAPIANPDAGKPEGAVSQLDVENALRFDNRMMAFDTTAAGLKAILEHSVAAGANQGRFGQIGGIRFSYDPDLAAGSRILNISLIDESGKVIARVIENGAVAADAPAVITVSTTNFTANGGDGYPIKENGENFRFLLTDGTLSAAVDEALDFTLAVNVPTKAMGEQAAFEDYMKTLHGTAANAFDVADTPEAEDTRIENLNSRADGVFVGITIDGDEGDNSQTGTAGDDVLRGAAGDDTIEGGAGDDTIEGGADDDTIDGGTGSNTAIFSGHQADYEFRSAGNVVTVIGPDGTDTLTNIQILRFADGDLPISAVIPSAKTIEAKGATRLVDVGDHFFLREADGKGPALKYQAAAVTEGQFGAWTPIATEITAIGYQVAWRNGTADEYAVWTTDSDGRYVSHAIGGVSHGDLALQTLETSFQQDLNGDGRVGVLTRTIEAAGSTSLQAVNQFFVLRNDDGDGPFLEYQGDAVTGREFGNWRPIGAESTETGFQVAWRNGTADEFSVWNTDANGNYTSNAVGVLHASDPALQALELFFQQDLNHDGRTGPEPAAPGLASAAAADALFIDDLASVQTVAHFDAAHDTLRLDHAVFAGLPLGQLDESRLASGAAFGSAAQLVYEAQTGALFYDGDGAGAAAATKFAVLSDRPDLTASNVFVV